jgi:hypothetical protein
MMQHCGFLSIPGDHGHGKNHPLMPENDMSGRLITGDGPKHATTGLGAFRPLDATS